MVRPDPHPAARRVVGLAGAILAIMVTVSCSSDATRGSVGVGVPTTHVTAVSGSVGSTTGSTGAARSGTGSDGSGIAGTAGSTTVPGNTGGRATTKHGHGAAAAGQNGPGRSSNQAGGPATGIPAPQQQFAGDDAAFESVLRAVQQAVGRLPTTAGAGEVFEAVLPLVAAADQYQGQIVNLPMSATAKPLGQSLTESLGQLTAVLDQVGQPSGFPSLGVFRSQLSSAAAAVRNAARVVRVHIARS